MATVRRWSAVCGCCSPSRIAESVRVDALVEQVGLPASTVYRYLRSLRDLGLVEETDGWYRPGDRLAHPDRAVANATLASIAKPILRELAAETGETALVTVRAGMAALCVEQAESPKHMRMAFEIGQLLPSARRSGFARPARLRAARRDRSRTGRPADRLHRVDPGPPEAAPPARRHSGDGMRDVAG